MTVESSNGEVVTKASSVRKLPTLSVQTRKPHVEVVEIDTDEEDRARETLPRGAARGLNPNNVLQTTAVRVTAEPCDEEADTKTSLPTHATRASRNGRPAVDYDMKYHPMDEVTRPKRAAARRGSGSLSVSFSVSLKRELSDETTDGSEPSMARDSSDEGSSETEEGDPETDSPLQTQRIPDPRASRHSARSEARKVVNYSRKHHPQDYGVPGFQHKARCRKPGGLTTPASTAQKRKGKGNAEIDLTQRDENDSDIDDIPSTKRVRHFDSPDSSLRATTKHAAKSITKTKRGRKRGAVLRAMDDSEMNSLVNDVIEASQPAPSLESDREQDGFVNEMIEAFQPAPSPAPSSESDQKPDEAPQPAASPKSSPASSSQRSSKSSSESSPEPDGEDANDPQDDDIPNRLLDAARTTIDDSADTSSSFNEQYDITENKRVGDLQSSANAFLAETARSANKWQAVNSTEPASTAYGSTPSSLGMLDLAITAASALQVQASRE